MSDKDRLAKPGALHPEELAELKTWAEDTAVERNWSYHDRLWVRGTVAKLIRAFEAKLDADRVRGTETGRWYGVNAVEGLDGSDPGAGSINRRPRR